MCSIVTHYTGNDVNNTRVTCSVLTARGVCVKCPAAVLSPCTFVCPSACPCPPVCLSVFLPMRLPFSALPNYSLGTGEIDWTELGCLWVTDRLSVAWVMQCHCMQTCRPSQLSVCPPARPSFNSVKLSASLLLLRQPGQFFLSPLRCFLPLAAVCPCVLIFPHIYSSSVHSTVRILSTFNSQTPFFHKRNFYLFPFLINRPTERLESD